jgi:competence protein CoiA
MHLYARDEKDQLISAAQGNKQTNYFCRECGGLVRCRGGFIRQMHFYHLEHNRHCRQSGKSPTHFQIQLVLQKKLPGCEIEKVFSSINRIADVVYVQEKIVFEIQCSSISAREIEERNRDYASLGYQVIWILHDRLFNKTRLTAAEFFLTESPHYFTNINVEGEGCFYDQWDVLDRGRRLKTLGFREINIAAFAGCNKDLFTKRDYPKWMQKRIELWPIYFFGDYLDLLLTSEETERAGLINPAATKEQLLLDVHQFILWEKLKEIMHFVALPYRLTLYLIMDKLTR